MTQKKTSLPFCLQIKTQKNELICNSDNIRIYKVLSHYEIFIEPFFIAFQAHCTTESLVVGKTNCIVNVWDNKVEFLTKDHSEVCDVQITDPIFKTVNGNAIIIGSNETQKVCAIFCAKTSKTEIIYAEQIEFDENKLHLLCDCFSHKEHKILRTYNFSENGYTISAPELYATPNNLHKNYVSELIPYLFLETLRVGDENLAKSYLLENLQQTNFSAFAEYFGDYEKINLHSTSPLVYIIYSTTEAKAFEFDMQNDKISDINRL